MKALFYHGWGFDSSIWDGISGLLPQWPIDFVDRGYFGLAKIAAVDAPCIAVTHSFGTMLALQQPPPQCVGIVALNGFDRFVASDAFPGVHPRIMRRMTDRFANDPKTVLREYRQRCGCDVPFPAIDSQVLGQDLRDLATLDCSALETTRNLPILSLQGDTDPILPPAMREMVFARSGRIERRTVPCSGHLLPMTHPEQCARTIREFAKVLT